MIRGYYRELKKSAKPKRFAALRDEPFLAWIRQQPCCIGGVRSGEWIWVPFPGGRTGKVPARIEAAHVKARSTAGPDRGNVVPMELSVHRAQHRMGIKTFQRMHNVNLPELAQKYAEEYERKHGER